MLTNPPPPVASMSPTPMLDSESTTMSCGQSCFGSVWDSPGASSYVSNTTSTGPGGHAWTCPQLHHSHSSASGTVVSGPSGKRINATRAPGSSWLVLTANVVLAGTTIWSSGSRSRYVAAGHDCAAAGVPGTTLRINVTSPPNHMLGGCGSFAPTNRTIGPGRDWASPFQPATKIIGPNTAKAGAG